MQNAPGVTSSTPILHHILMQGNIRELGILRWLSPLMGINSLNKRGSALVRSLPVKLPYSPNPALPSRQGFEPTTLCSWNELAYLNSQANEVLECFSYGQSIESTLLYKPKLTCSAWADFSEDKLLKYWDLFSFLKMTNASS